MDDDHYLRFQYTHTRQSTGERIECDYKVRLVTTPCHLGGVRRWFIYPLSREGAYCGRRVGKLYCPPGGIYYGCRHCSDLSCESRNESGHGRLAHMGYFLTLDRRRENLLESMKRWTYRGKPTRKALRLQILEAKLETYGKTHLADLI